MRRIQVRLEDSEWRRLVLLAATQRRTVSSQIRSLIDGAIEGVEDSERAAAAPKARARKAVECALADDGRHAFGIVDGSTLCRHCGEAPAGK